MRIVYIIIGSIICASSYALFLIPHRIVPGGVSGIAMILHFLYKTPVGTMTIILNIPLFILALRVLGVSFGFKSAFAIIITNLMIDFLSYTIKIHTPTHNVVLAALYGGALLGLGLGLIFRAGASTGGTDIVGQILNRFTNMSVGMSISVVDFVVITLAGLTTHSFELALFGYLALFISTKVIDLVLEGMDYARAAFVISQNCDKVVEEIYQKMGRGVTVLDGFSPYTKEKSR